MKSGVVAGPAIPGAAVKSRRKVCSRRLLWSPTFEIFTVSSMSLMTERPSAARSRISPVNLLESESPTTAE